MSQHAAAKPSLSEAEVLDRVLEHILQILPDLDGEITPSSSFSDDLEMDSLHVVELVSQLETSFECEIPASVESSARTPGELSIAIAELVGCP